MKQDNERAMRILRAADALFGAVGFDGVSVRDIAQRAEVNKALVFYYYDSKEALFETVVQRYYEGHRAALEAAFERSGTIRERFHRLMDAYVDYIDENRGYPRLIQRRFAETTEADTDLVRRGLVPLLQWTERALEELTPREGPLAARQFFLTFSGAVINFFTYGPMLAPMWNTDPLGDQGIAERRAHLHWLVDTVLTGLEQQRELQPTSAMEGCHQGKQAPR